MSNLLLKREFYVFSETKSLTCLCQEAGQNLEATGAYFKLPLMLCARRFINQDVNLIDRILNNDVFNSKRNGFSLQPNVVAVNFFLRR